MNQRKEQRPRLEESGKVPGVERHMANEKLKKIEEVMLGSMHVLINLFPISVYPSKRFPEICIRKIHTF